MHAAYTLFTSFPRTMLQHVLVDNGSVWQVLESLTNEVGDLTEMHPRLRRPVERELFLRIFPRLKSSRQTRGAFELEAAELRLGEVGSHATVSAKTDNGAFRCNAGEYELVTLPLPPDAYSRVVSAPMDEQVDQSFLLVRQGRQIHYYEAGDGATAVVDQISEASRTGGEVQFNPKLLQELLRIGVLKDVSQVPERR
jgi:hypothetical protein